MWRKIYKEKTLAAPADGSFACEVQGIKGSLEVMQKIQCKMFIRETYNKYFGVIISSSSERVMKFHDGVMEVLQKAGIIFLNEKHEALILLNDSSSNFIQCFYSIKKYARSGKEKFVDWITDKDAEKWMLKDLQFVAKWDFRDYECYGYPSNAKYPPFKKLQVRCLRSMKVTL